MYKARKLLYPFSIVYDGVTRIRNKLYDWDFLSSKSYDLPVIGVGNLNTGGTGKSPMIEYLIRLLYEDFKLATLSRGYKRKSQGFQYVQFTDSVTKSGDESLQFKMKFPDAAIAVDANRREGIEILLKEQPDLVLLDDVFQHRKVKAGLQILLTSYGDLYCDDFILPAGNLRESTRGAKRANLIIVTKTPFNISEKEMVRITDRLKPLQSQSVFFTGIAYSENIKSKHETQELVSLKQKPFTLVTGIANSKPLEEFLRSYDLSFDHLKFPDHHSFRRAEIRKIAQKSLILTTEKDYMRLKDHVPAGHLFYLPIKTEFIRNRNDFDKLILDFVKKKK